MPEFSYEPATAAEVVANAGLDAVQESAEAGGYKLRAAMVIVEMYSDSVPSEEDENCLAYVEDSENPEPVRVTNPRSVIAFLVPHLVAVGRALNLEISVARPVLRGDRRRDEAP